MDLLNQKYSEKPLVKTKIIATVGPACATYAGLKSLAIAGVDIFRLNFAHGAHDWLTQVVNDIRAVSAEMKRPLGILGDLSGPKIRLGLLPEEGLCCIQGGIFEFVRSAAPSDITQLTCTYEQLIDDLTVDDRIIMADGVVSMRVISKDDQAGSVKCIVEQPGCIRSRQGVNLPGVNLKTPCLTEKDLSDLAWSLEHDLDFIGLSFVRSASDIVKLREAISASQPRQTPAIVAKIEKLEAIEDFENILEETDAIMVARGDLGVEVDLPRVPILQKQIIAQSNARRIPVITATQMLDSMQLSELPTRAEASDVANAVLDGSDAVMLSGETAIGTHPVKTVAMMSRICQEAEQYVTINSPSELTAAGQYNTTAVTEAVTRGAGTSAASLNADLIVVATHSGRTALAISKQRAQAPVLALTDRPDISRRMSLYWGVTPLETEAVNFPPSELLHHVVEWGKQHNVLKSGSRLVLVGSTDWSAQGHDLMLVHAVP